MTASAFVPLNKIGRKAAFSAAPLNAPSIYTTAATNSRSASSSLSMSDEAIVMPSGQTTITRKGYGFSTSMSRVLRKTGQGYYKASTTDRVIDVIKGISLVGVEEDEVNYDVALVFDESDELFGIFTERDYITFSTARAAAGSEEESASYLVAPVANYVTRAADILTLSNADKANDAIKMMEMNGVRHLLVADSIENNRMAEGSKIEGVVSMKNVMAIVQNDERISLDFLEKKYPGLSGNPMEQMKEQMRSMSNLEAKDPGVVKEDIIRVGTAVLSASALATFFSNSPWLHDHADLAMVGIFILGYIGIIFEEVFEFNKAAIALLMSTAMWVTYADYFGGSSGIASETVLQQLGEQLSEVSDICFFLLAASAIVEVVDAHQGFKVVTNKITTKSKKGLFWTIGFLTFFLSSILNNLTVTIVMVSLLRKLVPNEVDRRLFGAMVVVAANAGGVWTPIGDVTTTMLWINGQLTTVPTVTQLFLPSVVCLVGSLAFLVGQVDEDSSLEESTLPEPSSLAPRGTLVFWFGIAALLAVPVFNELTGLPPYLAMLTGLGAMWTLTDVIHMGEDKRDGFRLPAALAKLDISGILFFLGILMSIGVLDKSGLLKELAEFLNNNLPNQEIIATVIGLASALIDNVPLVAATMGMYEISDFVPDDQLWQLIALCAGTGGSILIIGSASGVALMGLEKVDFLWYTKNVSIGAAVGYFAGIATYLAQSAVLHGGLIPPALAAGDVMQSLTGIV
eukprot:CAMPEP_0195522502 /NCGR_PEP_ID=MMETSP0794_2-20130614/20732_1 /TAXON_ID=515487 /ORGANISM="Stephanopyxis turris, Strain CCMP 815" /LENGTH=740 /DNA_ID=CAMNT_0040652273 /DNA_START=82 /DNA_END=2304 /DNA_ORIENTATION=+